MSCSKQKSSSSFGISVPCPFLTNVLFFSRSYDAEKGRASIYVDNQLVGTKTVDITFDREARDIQWSFESENAKTRIGNG